MNIFKMNGVKSIMAVLICCLCGCVSTKHAQERNGNNVNVESSAANGIVKKSNDYQFNSALSERYMEFSLSFFKELAKEEDFPNLCIAPFSLYNLLTLISFEESESSRGITDIFLKGGADGRKEMCSYLNNLSEIMISRNPAPGQYQEQWCSISNSLWYLPGLVMTEEFSRTVQNFPNLEVFPINPNGVDGQQRINLWASKATKGLIPDLFSRPLSNVECLLANAIYFRGLWRKEFKAEDNKPEKFENLNNSEGNATYMVSYSTESYAENEDLKVLRMSLGRDYHIRFYLPKEGKDFRKIIKKLSVDEINKLKAKEESYDVKKEIPKFKYSSKVDLNDYIYKLNGKRYFECRNMFVGRENIFSKCIQSFSINLDEKGVESAAITFLTAYGAAYPFKEYPKAEMILNRPFFYTIEFGYPSTILFIGMVTNL